MDSYAETVLSLLDVTVARIESARVAARSARMTVGCRSWRLSFRSLCSACSLSQASHGGFAPRFYARLFGYGERVPVVGFRAGEAEVAGEISEDLGGGPEGHDHVVGSDWPGGVGQERLISGFGPFEVIDGDGEQAA